MSQKKTEPQHKPAPSATAAAAEPRKHPPKKAEEQPEAAWMVIAGAGIVGLVLALALKKRLGIRVEIYEQAREFQDGLGCGIGMYPNGLRVIEDIDPSLCQTIQSQGFAYEYRRWERHDGTEVAVAQESVLADGNLASLGIRRWRLQRALFDAVQAEGIKIHFQKKLSQVIMSSGDENEEKLVHLHFEDGTMRRTRLLFAADGAKSMVRNVLAGHVSRLEYTGTTCLYGVAGVARETRGICFPSSDTTKCHGCFYPVGDVEQCFQFHIPTLPNSNVEGGWGTLLTSAGDEEFKKLAEKLRRDGWHEKYVTPLLHVQHAIKVPFALLQPPLEHYVYHNRIVLVGDAAHPPVPYLGQGAQQGLEDAGTLALLLQKLCLREDGTFSMTHVDTALRSYDRIRVPRTKQILDNSKYMGKMQQKRAEVKKYNETKEELIKRDVFFHQTMQIIKPGACHDYKEDVEKALKEHTHLLPVVVEETGEG